MFAIAYAAQRPERICHLLLWCTGAQAGASGPLKGLDRLAPDNWEVFTETFAHVVLGWPIGDTAHRWAAMMREGSAKKSTCHVPRQ